MGLSEIKIQGEGLDALRRVLAEEGETYKTELKRLCNLMEEITCGDIQGGPAEDLLQKFKAKESMFYSLANTIDEAEAYSGMKKSKFTGMLGELESGMK